MDPNLLKELASGWHEIDITLSHYGRGPKKLGDGVYKFGAKLSLPVILPPRGWTLVNKARSYVYLKPPEGVRPPFIITVKVPSEEQAKAIFQALYNNGKTWAGYIGEWPAIYLHDHGYQAYLIGNDAETGGITKTLYQERKVGSSLKLGENGAWEVSIQMRNGEVVYHGYNPKFY